MTDFFTTNVEEGDDMTQIQEVAPAANTKMTVAPAERTLIEQARTVTKVQERIRRAKDDLRALEAELVMEQRALAKMAEPLVESAGLMTV